MVKLCSNLLLLHEVIRATSFGAKINQSKRFTQAEHKSTHLPAILQHVEDLL